MNKTQTENKDALQSQAKNILMAINTLKTKNANLPKVDNKANYHAKAENQFNKIMNEFSSGVITTKIKTNTENQITQNGTLKVVTTKQEIHANAETLAKEMQENILKETGFKIDLRDTSKVSEGAKVLFCNMVNKDLKRYLRSKNG